MYVCMCICTLLSMYMSKINGRDYEYMTTDFDFINCQNFSMKTRFILNYLFIYLFFILITLVGLHNIHVLNYAINIIKKLHTKH